MPLKKLAIIIVIFLTVADGLAQKSNPVLATATGLTVTVDDLSAEGKKLYENRQTLINNQRTRFFNDWAYDLLLETEAGARGTTPEKLQAEEIIKVAKPTEAQVKAVYETNRQTIGSRSIDEIRPQIVEFLKRDLESKQLHALFNDLKTKHKFVPVKDVNASDLRPMDVVASIGSRTFTAADFETRFKLLIHNLQAGIYAQIRSDAETAAFSKLLDAEAKKRNTDAAGVIAAEITNKLKDYSDYERMSLEDSLQSRLFDQYSVKFSVPANGPMVLNVSTDDDPAVGNPTAKVTVVTFVDFQCSACAAFSPLLKQVVSEFGGDVRLVVRDFPLTAIHANAMDAALAGYAARQQGKFFELGDLMYRNQDTLDRDSLKKLAQQVGLNLGQFERDLSSAAAAEEVKKDMMDGKNYGVNGTPTVFVNGVQLQRLTTYAAREAIKNALKK